MDNYKRYFIDEHLYRHFLHFMESADASELAKVLTPIIANDIEETAYSGDIDIALARLLMKTFVEG